jgi:hypothetical protein
VDGVQDCSGVTASTRDDRARAGDGRARADGTRGHRRLQPAATRALTRIRRTGGSTMQHGPDREKPIRAVLHRAPASRYRSIALDRL